MENIKRIFIINLDDRRDRWFYCEHQAKLFNFKRYERFSAIKHTNGMIGCTLSHKKLIEYCLDYKDDDDDDIYLILEDDFFFIKPIEEIKPIIKHLYFRKDLWDVFCFSRTYEQFYDENIDSIFYRIEKCHSTCAFMFKRKMLEIFSRSHQQAFHNNIPIDVSWLDYMKIFRFYSTRYPIIKQMNSYSNIEKKINVYQENSYILLHPKGQLGNILFQIAAAVALSLKNQKFLYITHSKEFTDYNKKFKLFTNFDYNDTLRPKSKITYNDIPYKPLVVDKNESYLLDGYFQSPLYFKEFIPEGKIFFDLLHIPDFIKNKANKYLESYKGYELIAVHVRRGDYINKHNHNIFIDLMKTEYYKKAIDKISLLLKNKRKQFLIFSNEPEYIKKNSFLNIYKVVDEYNDVLFHFYLMTRCHHYIIANSSFSWWGAYLSSNTSNKIVLRPDKFFYSTLQEYEIRDMFLSHWIPLISSDTTIVTMYYPINKSKYSRRDYEEKWIPNLMKIKTPMVIFTSHDMVPYFKKLREHYSFGTFIYILEFKDLYANQFYFDIDKDPEKNIHSKELYIIWNSKVSILEIASTKNYFDTKYFMYLDIAIFREIIHYNYNHFPQISSIKPYLDKKKICVCYINNHNTIMGGFLVGVQDSIRNFHQLYYNELEKNSKKIFYGKDQILYTYLYHKYPKNFHVIESDDLDDSGENPWFKILWHLCPMKSNETNESNRSKFIYTFIILVLLLLLICTLLYFIYK